MTGRLVWYPTHVESVPNTEIPECVSYQYSRSDHCGSVGRSAGCSVPSLADRSVLYLSPNKSLLLN